MGYRDRRHPSVAIAIIDTGVDWNHPDLAANICANPGEIAGNGIDDDGNGYIDDIRGWDFVNFDSDPMDDNGHGTHCSGIAAAETNNGVGVAGVCWNCAIMPLKGLDEQGSGYHSDLAIGIQYAADNGADVISMSWGSYSYSNLIKDVIDYAYSQGLVLVGSAGNHDTYKVIYPAGYSNVIAVSATDNTDSKAFSSNYGSWIDVAAPGVNIYSTMPTYQVYLNTKYGIQKNYAYLSGTSMSTPYVAGLSGLILSRNQIFSNEEVRNILRSTVDPVISTEYIGLGRINAYNAILRNSTLIANLDSSRDDACVQDVISINGTASGNNFHKYELYYGLGVYPTDWTQIGSTQYTQVVDGVLATWDTSLTIDGTHSIRLEVMDVNGKVTEDRAVLRIDNALQDGWPIYLDTFALLASPVTFDFNNNGKNEIVIATYGPAGDSYGSGRIYVINSNGTIADGWPFITNYCAPATPAIGDLNNDGTPEIVATSWNYIYVLHFDGSLVWQKAESEISSATPVLVDMDGNGGLEIILTARAGKIFAWNYDGSNVDGWPITINASYEWPLSTPAVGDIDNDGHVEIVVNTENNETYVLNHDGTIADGWPQYIPSVSWWAVNRAPALADLNGDDDLEIIIDAVDKLYVLNHDGTIADGWPNDILRYGNTAFSLGDLDSDGLPEIVFGKSGYPFGPYYLYALNGDSSDVMGWPIILPSAVRTPCVIADINSDSTQEVIVRGTDRIYIFNSDGSSVEGWPKTIEDFTHSGTLNPSPLVTDLDGDGDIEIVALSFFNSVYVWDLSGTYDPDKIEWPMFQHDMWHTGLYGFVPSVNDGITLEVTPIDNEVLPGETATYEVSVTYFMDDPPTEHVVLSIDNPIWSYTFDPAEFDITSGESKYSTLSISVPTNTQPGTYEHTVNATATGQIGPVTITEWVTTDVETEVIPEFTTIAIPVAVIFGLILLIRRRKRH